jgi:RNA polymerase sigma-70 factor, ECF subfamily
VLTPGSLRGHPAVPVDEAADRGVGGTALAQICDVADSASVTQLVAAAFRRFGAVDTLVNNVGVSAEAGVMPERVPDELFALAVQVNLAVVQCLPVAVRSDRLGSDLQPEHLEQYRRELTGYCYRMLGSGFEADDAVQETMVRAWRAADGFEGRASVRSWVYRIATNVCLDMLRGRQRRARPMEMGPSSPADASHLGPLLPEHMWVTPIADTRVLPESGDPAELAEARESIRLAFVAALQHLPARQRAVLILREVLRWQATEVAELLGTSVPSVNSALQRARATLAARDFHAGAAQVVDADQQDLLARYVDAFERYDIPRLVTLLHDDAIQSMPPYAMWLRGPEEIGRWLLGAGIGCRGSRLIATQANGCTAFGQYRVDPAGGRSPWALQVVEVSGDRISAFHAFLNTDLFGAFGLPAHLDD